MPAGECSKAGHSLCSALHEFDEVREEHVSISLTEAIYVVGHLRRSDIKPDVRRLPFTGLIRGPIKGCYHEGRHWQVIGSKWFMDFCAGTIVYHFYQNTVSISVHLLVHYAMH